MQEQEFYTHENEENDLNFWEYLEKYLVHWKWFIISVFISLFLAFIYLQYTTPEYKASTTILMKDEQKGGMPSELSVFADMGIGSGMKSNLDNEIEILKSRTLIENTVKKLNLNTSLIVREKIKDREIYQETPIDVYFVDKINRFYENNIDFKFTELAPGSFKLEDELVGDNSKIILSNKKEFRYGELIPTKYGRLVISKPNFNGGRADNHQSINIIISPLDNVIESFKGRIKVEPINKMSSVVTVSITDPVVKKSEAFLDNLIQIYNQDAAADKNFISENTSKFIANRLTLITQELDGVEKDVENFKKSNKLTDIESEAKLFIEGSSEYDKKGVEAEIQLNVVSSMLDFMKKSTNSDLLPGNIITGQSDTSGLISSYNQLVLDRNRILKSATTANPSVVKMDQQIASLKATVAASLLRLQSSLNIQKTNLNSNEGILNAKIGKIPVQERQFRVISRQQKVKEELYLYLLQKREETAISLSATEPNARVIDAAKAGKIPVSPNKNVIYLSGLLLGLLIPFGIIYTDDLLNTKIKYREDIESKITVPFLGDIPKSFTHDTIITSNSRSNVAEAICIMENNLESMLGKVPDGLAKTIFVTSSLPKEGKTFITVNLAATIALSGKKVLIIGLDLRNPKLKDYLEIPSEGISNYLTKSNEDVNDYIVKLPDFQNLYVLPSGVVPTNPVKLLKDDKVNILFDQLKKEYDYIVVDTAPVTFVTDTFLIAKNADAFIYVTRANYSDKRLLKLIAGFYKGKRLPNMGIVLNDTTMRKTYGYGTYDYGAGTGTERKAWYKELSKN